MESNALTRLSLEAALRSLDLQERAVEQLRNRTSALLAAASFTASFLGGQTLGRTGSLNVFGVLALACLVCAVGLCVYVLMPRRAYVFGVSGWQMHEALSNFRDDERELQRRVVYWLGGFWRRNQGEIDKIDRCYAYASVTLLLQLVFWSLSLATTIRYR